MSRLLHAGLSGMLLLSCFGAQGQQEFTLIQVKEICPEYGIPITKNVLYTSGKKIAFEPPNGWRLTTDTTAKRILFRSTNGPASLSLTLNIQDTSVSRAQPTPVAGAPKPEPDADYWRRLVLDRLPDASIVDQSVCYARGLKVWVFDCNYRSKNGGQQAARFAFLPFDGGIAQLELVVSGQLQSYSGVFLGLLNSVDIQPFVAPKREGP